MQKLPVVFALDRAGIVGEDGPTHHGVFDYSYLRHIPNLTIMAPKDENELKDMLATAFSLRTPVVIRYPRGNGLGVEVKTEYQHIPVGMSEEISIGSDVMFLAVGAMVDSCVEAVNLLKEKNVSAGVINARFIKPLDERMIEVLAKTVKYIVTIEDNMLAGGFGSAVLEALNEREFCDTKVLRLGYPDKFIEQGKRENLLELYKLTPAHIAARTYAFIRNIEVR